MIKQACDEEKSYTVNLRKIEGDQSSKAENNGV